MRIAVNARLLTKGKLEGIGRFTHETLIRITRDHPEHEFIFLFDRKVDEEFIYAPNVKAMVLFPQARHPFLWYLFFEWSVTRALKKVNADLFLSTDGWLSLSTNVPSVDVIHDLNFEHHPQHLKKIPLKYYHYFFPRFAKKAKRLATVSKFSADDISKTYGIDRNKIDVVYNGSSDVFQPMAEAQKEKIRNKYSGGSPYFMFVGLIHQRKNIANMISAFDRFQKRQDNDWKIVIVGEKKWWTKEMQDALDDVADEERVIFTGRLPEQEMWEAMSASSGLIYVPFFEGFGIPILEAMYCDIPVITSNITSMPEVGGEAALLVDPYNIEEIAAAMARIAFEPGLSAKMIEKGRIQREKFSWDKTAGELWACVDKVIKDH